MEKNDKIIFEYFSGLMTDSQKQKFEADIENNISLRKRFYEIKNQLEEINLGENDIEFNELYFSSMLPKIRNRISKKRSIILEPKYIFSFSSFAAAIILLLVLLPGKDNVDFSLHAYQDQIENIFAESNEDDIDDFFTEDFSFNLSEFDLLSDNINLIDELQLNYNDSKDYNSSYLEDSYDYIEDLDEDEFKIIINEISEQKIL